MKKTETALARHRHSHAHTALQERAKSLGTVLITLPPCMSKPSHRKGVCGNCHLMLSPPSRYLKDCHLQPMKSATSYSLYSLLPSSTAICVVCKHVTDVKQASQCLSLTQRDFGVACCARTPPTPTRVDAPTRGITLLPGSEMWRSTQCFCSSPHFTDSKDGDGEEKCLFCCKKVSASGPPGAARAMLLISAQIIEELIDKAVLLKRMVWKWLTGHQREWVKGSLNDTEDWPCLTDTVNKIEIRYFHSS